MKMAKHKQNMTGMVIFERPVQIAENTIHGILYDKRVEQIYTDMGYDISDYISYMVGCEQFLKNGGSISMDGSIWFYPDGVHELLYNFTLQRLLEMLMRDIVKTRIIEFDKPIEWKEGEVDDEGAPCFIIDHALIERYTKEQVEQ